MDGGCGAPKSERVERDDDGEALTLALTDVARDPRIGKWTFRKGHHDASVRLSANTPTHTQTYLHL